ncbi:DUF599 domain-containing protein [Thiorhodovibrio litoralis]|uniref:DUF599 domain-containing protein n=1 Tax=Thiorhodovibrio litoralis TaxID=2952932 RepID=UPI002B2601F0|nr:DUF599 domain-containing protein [Thiorhodovibrio litoralis]
MAADETLGVLMEQGFKWAVVVCSNSRLAWVVLLLIQEGRVRDEDVYSIVITDKALEIGLSGSAISLLVLYHLFHAWEVRARPEQTSFGRNSLARARWAAHIMRKGSDILAVQTLRNWTMGATLLASTAIVLALGILSFALSSDGVDQLNSIVHIAGVRSHALAVIKALLAVFIYLIGFVSFSLCIRFYNHAAFLLNLPPGEGEEPDPTAAIHAISRGAGAYNFGMRAYYVSIPLMLWLLGPIWFFLGAVVMIFLIYRLDHGSG